MTKKKKRVAAVIGALAIAAAIPVIGYVSSVDGALFANGNPLTWRWGGMSTTQEEPESHAPDGYTLAMDGQIARGPVIRDTCPECDNSSNISANYTVKAATCTETGTRAKRCPQCGHTWNETTISALGHSYSWKYTATTDTYSCTRCNDVQETRAHTHSYSWVQTTAPTYDSEGEESYKCSTCGDISETRVIPELAEPVELPEEPERDGYTFTGWYFDEDCTEPYDGRPIYADTVLYAGWRKNTFTVTFNTADGKEATTQTVEWNTAATLATPARVGYTFLGWFMTDGTEYEAQAVTEDLTLTAHWERIKCTVTFYVSGELYTSLTVDYGTPLIQAVVQAGLFSEDVIAYAYMNGDNVGNELAGVKVTDDMTVSANEPTREEKIKGSVNNYWLPATSCALGAVAVGLLLWAIFSGKRKKGNV